MKEEKVFIAEQDLKKWFRKMKAEGHSVYLPEQTGDGTFSFTDDIDNFSINPFRCIEPLRTFINPLLENLGDYFSKQPEEEIKPQVVFGVKSCDLQSLKIQDYIFLQGDCVDPVYKKFRDNTLFISSDCTDCKEVCFCTGLGIEPYPKEDFDLNLSQIEGGFTAEIGSEKGRELVDRYKEFFSHPESAQVQQIEGNRKKISQKLHTQTEDFPAKEKLYEAVKNNYNSDVYKKESERCVECGACVFGCPTCHCFLLYDEKKSDKYIRTRIWDACQFKNFMKEAGGSNPLEARFERLRNRYAKKFDFFWKNIQVYGCTGCGRCYEFCIGNIDIRHILKTVAEEEDASNRK